MNRDFLRRLLVVLNVGLGVSAVILVWPRGAVVQTTTSPSSRAAPARAPATEPSSLHFPDAETPAKQRRWLVDQLRAMGVPNQVLARVVMKDLDQRWNKRAAELTLKTRGDPEALTALNLEIERSRDADMRDALGAEGFKEWDTENMHREVDTGKVEFSPSETDAAYALWKKLRQRDLELRELKYQGKIDEAGAGEAYAKDVAEFQRQMKTLLGDERYADTQAVGPRAAAANLRQEVAKANPTDAQFQELLNTQQQYNDLRADLARQPPDDAAYVQRLKDLDEARDEEFRRVLGADAFDALQKQQDFSYAEMKKYEQTWGLDDAKIDYVYGALKYYQKTAEDYQAGARALEAKGQTVDWDAVNKNLQRFAQQTRQALQSYVGADSFDKLQRNGVVQFNQPPGDLPNSNNGRPY